MKKPGRKPAGKLMVLGCASLMLGLWSPDAGALFYLVDIPVAVGVLVAQLHVHQDPGIWNQGLDQGD